MNKLGGLLAVLTIVAVLLSGCSPTPAATPAPTQTKASTPVTSSAPAVTNSVPASPSSAAGPKIGGDLKVIYDSMAPIYIGYPPEINIDAATAAQVCIEGLLREDGRGNLTPWLASSFKLSDDLKSVTFTLNKGIKFHDGSDFNARVAKWNLDNQILAKTQPYWASVDVLDDFTVRVNFKEWRNTLLRSFADTPAGWMISKAAFDKHGLDWVKQNPVGTGPFVFFSYARDTGLMALKNIAYWQAGKPYLDSVDIIYNSDPENQKTLVQNTGADMVFLSEAGKQTTNLKNLGFSIQCSQLVSYVLVPDTANADSPFAKQSVREAVEYAMNKGSYPQKLGDGYWGVPSQVLSHDTVPFDPNRTPSRQYDLNQAKKLLADAGYTEFLKVSLICAPGLLNGSLESLVQADLYAAGIDASLDYPELPAWQSYNTRGWKNAFVLQPITGYPNYNYSLQYYWAPTSPYNRSWLRAPEWNQAYNKSLVSQSPDVQLIRGVTDIMTQQTSVIPVIEVGRGWAYRSSVMNAGLLERGLPSLWKPEQTWLSK